MLNTLTLILSYLLGSIPFALIVGKFFYKKDIRQHGSGNLGATNTYRILGKKAALFVAIGDVTKGTAACFLPLLLGASVDPIYCGLIAIIGHVYPVFARFKGGKAIGTSAGVFLYLTPIGILAAFIVFVITIFLTKMVSLGSIIASFTLLVYSLFFEDTLIIALTAFIVVFVLYLHRQNIQRIITGTENKINKR